MSIAPVVERLYGSKNVRRSAVDTSAEHGVVEVVPVTPIDALSDTEILDRQRLQSAVDAANKFLQPVARNLQFFIDEATGHTIVKVVDTETNQVVRQIPKEEMFAISRALGRLKGMMVEQEA